MDRIDPRAEGAKPAPGPLSEPGTLPDAACRVCLAAILESAVDLMTVVDGQGLILAQSPSVKEVLGYEPGELVGSSAFDLVHPEHLAEAREALGRILAEPGRRHSTTLRVRHKSGQWRLVESSSMALPCGEGQGAVVTHSRDMTMEGEMRKLAAAIESASEMVLVTDAKGSIEYANPAFCAVTGYAREEIIGRNPRVLKSGRHDRAFYESMWSSVLAGRSWRGRVTNRRKDGTLYDCDLRVFPVREPSGLPRRFMALARDVTAESNLEGQLRQAQKMESLGLLAGGVAHDFNNLLTIIMGNNSLLLDGLKDLPALAGFARMIKKTVERGAGVSRQLLAFSRKQFVFLKPLDLNAAASEAAQFLQRLLGDNIAVSLDLAPDLWPVRADPGQLSQVFVNLAVNAKDAMPGGGALTLVTRNAVVGAGNGDPLPPGDYACLTVSDTGVGMDEAVQARIFEPFFSTKGPAKGTGLGLSIVYGIVSQCGGRISVESKPGGGTTFRILLPRSALAPQQGAAEPSGPTGEGLDAGAVLVVEDNADLRGIVEAALEAKGCEVLTAGTGSEAQDVFFANEREVRYLLTDLMLPDTSGIKLAGSLRKAKPGLKVVFMSGYADIGDESLPPGAGLLPKPFSPDELLESLRRA